MTSLVGELPAGGQDAPKPLEEVDTSDWASELLDKKAGTYTWQGKTIKASELVDIYAGWTAKYPLVSIEDGLAEDDWEGWAKLTTRLGEKVQLVGDDLFVTNVERLARGIKTRTANSILVKYTYVGDANLDGLITADELTAYVQRNVREASAGKQNPTVGGSFDNNMLLAYIPAGARTGTPPPARECKNAPLPPATRNAS